MKLYQDINFYLENNNLTNKELAIRANCSESTINRYKRKLNITFAMLKNPTWNYYKLLSDTPESFYWAGFLLADGCFSEEERKVKISVSSSILDEFHIIKFKNWLETNNKLCYTNDNSVAISVYSKKYVPKIMKYWGFSYRKTYVPYEIPNHIYDHEFFKYFVIGLIDGDGSVIRTNNTYKISITQHKCQESFFLKLQDYLMNHNHKLYISDRDNTVNLTIQRPEIKSIIKSWYTELKDLPLKRKLDKMI